MHALLQTSFVRSLIRGSDCLRAVSEERKTRRGGGAFWRRQVLGALRHYVRVRNKAGHQGKNLDATRTD